MPKSLCNHEMSVVVVVVICDQFSYTHTKSKKVPFFTCSGIIIQLYIHESPFLHVLVIPALKLVPLQLAHLKTSGHAKFGPVNTKESDV